jgi:hypothetical protein
MANPFGTPLSEVAPMEPEEYIGETPMDENEEEQQDTRTYTLEANAPARFWEVTGSFKVTMEGIQGPGELVDKIQHVVDLWAYLDKQYAAELEARPSRVGPPAATVVSNDPTVGTPATKKHKDFVMSLLKERGLTPADFGFDIATVSKEYLNSIIDSEIKPKPIVNPSNRGGWSGQQQAAPQQRQYSGGSPTNPASKNQLDYRTRLMENLSRVGVAYNKPVPTSSADADAQIKELSALCTQHKAWPERK